MTAWQYEIEVRRRLRRRRIRAAIRALANPLTYIVLANVVTYVVFSLLGWSE